MRIYTRSDLTGQVYNRLTFISFSHGNKNYQTYWKCLCSCGNTRIINSTHVKRGHTKSCGCLAIETISNSKHRTTHGMTGTSTYNIWQNMIRRCTNPKSQDFHLYGERGIKVCDKWFKFENFLTDMGERPKGMSIERQDNNKGYSPTNCIWTTAKKQARNKRNNRLVTYLGKTKSLAQWAEDLGMNYDKLKWRINNWPIKDAFTAQ